MRLIEPTPRYIPLENEIPSGICECGCGEQTVIARATLRRLRWFKGHPKPFITGHHANRGRGRVRTTAPGMLLSEREVGYFAALVDGEGTISVRGRAVRISIGNTDEALMEWLAAFGGGVSPSKLLPNRRQHWVWSLGNRHDVQWLLSQIESAMIIKRERALHALDLVNDLIATHG